MHFNRRHLVTGALATAFIPAAPAIVKAATARRSIFEFGDGATQKTKSEATADYGNCFNAAANSGSPIEVPTWRYPFRTLVNERCVYVNAQTSIDFGCAPDAVFIAGAELSGKRGSLFYFRNPNGPIQATNVTFRFTGGFFDGSKLTSAPADGSGLGMLDIYQYAVPYIANVSGYGGTGNTADPATGNLGFGFTDTMMITHNCFKEQIINLRGKGFYDCMLYVSGDNNGDTIDGQGEQGVVEGLVATNCGNGIAAKRDYIGLIVRDAAIWNCQNGIIGGTADGDPDNQGKRTQISGGYIGRIQGRPIVVFGTNPIVENVTIGDYGLNATDLRTPTGTRTGNEIAAIDLLGCTGGSVTGNAITTRSIASDPRRGIALRKDPTGRVTTGTTVQGNNISGPSAARYIFVESGSSGNIGSNP